MLSRKLPTTRANVNKVEMAMYSMHVRGGETPTPVLMGAPTDWQAQQNLSDDDGYC